jgi:hypothetical protein
MRAKPTLPGWKWTIAVLAGTFCLSCGGASAADDAAKDAAPILSAARIAAAKNRVESTPQLGRSDKTNLFKDLPGDGAVLVGFEIGVGPFFNDEGVYALRPIYLTTEGEVNTETFGLFNDKRLPDKRVIRTRVKRTLRVVAKPGYAVGGVTLRTGLNIDGMSITFMRINGRTLDPQRSYESEWIGGRGGSAEKLISGDGAPIIGIYGNQNPEHVYSLGLYYIKDGAPAEAIAPPPVKKPAEPVDKPAPKPVDAAPAQPEVEPDDPAPSDRDADASPYKRQADSGSDWGTVWLPVGVFAVVTIPLVGALLLFYGRSKQPTPELGRDRPRNEDETTAPKYSPRRFADQDEQIATSPSARRPVDLEPWDYPPIDRFSLERQGRNGFATTSLVLGGIGLLAWCLPILGLPITVTGLVMGVKGLQSYKQGAAITGIILNIIGIVLSLINAALGAYIALASQHGHYR